MNFSRAWWDLLWGQAQMLGKSTKCHDHSAVLAFRKKKKEARKKEALFKKIKKTLREKLD